MSAIVNHKRSYQYYEEEPPEKKILSDGDILIKQLYEKQKNTKISLQEHLLKPKEFQKSTDFIPITNFTAGTSNLSSFVNITEQCHEIDKSKRAGLTEDDIDLLLDFKKGENVYIKHKNLDIDVLKQHLNRIQQMIKDYDKKQQSISTVVTKNRHKTEFALSVKPESIETKLLKFALDNEQKNNYLPHPMDDIKNIEKDFDKYLSDISQPDIKKIRKKARSLGNQIKNITDEKIIEKNSTKSPCKNSKWDMQTVIEEKPKLHIKQSKTYTCKPQNFYTIKNRQIIKLNDTKQNKINETTKTKLSVEEIKQLPKFKNYNCGNPTKVLFLKNLANDVTEMDLKEILKKYTDNCVEIKLMKGKMRGQAFVTFINDAFAITALNEINGTFIRNKPIIIEYGKGKQSNT